MELPRGWIAVPSCQWVWVQPAEGVAGHSEYVIEPVLVQTSLIALVQVRNVEHSDTIPAKRTMRVVLTLLGDGEQEVVTDLETLEQFVKLLVQAGG